MRDARLRLLTASAYFESHRGGVELVAGRLARELVALGVEVRWMAADVDSAPAPEPGLSTVGLPVWNGAERRFGTPFPLPGLSALRRIWSAVGGADALLLHDAFYPCNVAAFVAARLRRKPVLLVQHIGEVPYRHPLPRLLMTLADRFFVRPLLTRADQVVFISEVTRRFFGSVSLRRPPALVFNGVDTRLFHPAQASQSPHCAMGWCLPREPLLALFVGRFVEKKGLAYIEAAARADPATQWVLAGWGPMAPEAWGLANVRVFRDLDHSSLPRLYRAADVFVLPSVGEGFPLVVQEALATGLPVVCGEETATVDAEAAELLAGAPLHPDAPERTAAAILEAIAAADKGVATAHARAAFVSDRYTWARAAERYLALVEPLGADSRGG